MAGRDSTIGRAGVRGDRASRAPQEGTIKKALRSALRRLAVTLPFFATATVLLALYGRPRESVSTPPVVLIVTTEALHPAFDALESWNEARGCPARVITLPERPSGTAWLNDLGISAAEVRGLLLGGDRAQVPGISEERDPPSVRLGSSAAIPFTAREPGLRGLPVLRAPVRDLAEAWAFFDACRAKGQTLDRLLSADVVAWDAKRTGRGPADLAAVARPR